MRYTARNGRPLKIGFVAWRDLDHPQAGGSEVVVDELLRGLQSRGHDVRLMCGGPVGERDYPVHALGGTYTQYLRAPFTHARRFREVDVLVDVQNGIPFFSPLWRMRPTVCLVHHVHTDQWAGHFSPPVAALGRTLESRVMPWAYRKSPYVAVSPGTAQDLATLGIAEDQISVVTNGVVSDERSAARSETPMFLALGRLVPHKRLDLLLDLWERVRQQTGGRLVIAGDGPELEALRSRDAEGVELLGSVTHEEKQRLLSEAWMLVHPAHHEGWGMVVLEAAMMRTPTLAFNVPGMRDTVRPGQTGHLASCPDDFANAWQRLAADRTELAELGDAARTWAQGFTWEHSVRKFERVLLTAADVRSIESSALPNAIDATGAPALRSTVAVQ